MKVVNFFVGVAGGRVQLLVWALAIGGFAWWFNHATAVAYSDGAAAGREATLKEQVGEVERRVAETVAAMAQERAELETQRTALAGQRKAVLDQIKLIPEQVSAGIAKLSSLDTELRHEIQSIPDSAVVSRYRAALLRARTAEASRTVNR